MEKTADNDLRTSWDRLALLFVSRPREGWEPEYEELAKREIERLDPLVVAEKRGSDE